MPDPPAPPGRLTTPVDGEPRWLTTQRQSLARQWSFSRRDSVLRLLEVAAMLITCDRDDEALELVSALVDAIPTPEATKDRALWGLSRRGLAVRAHILERGGDTGAQTSFVTRLGSQWEVPRADAIRQDIYDLWVRTFNARHHPRSPQLEGTSLLAMGMVEAIFLQRLALSVEPYSTWYGPQTLDTPVRMAADGLRERMVSRFGGPPPAGYVPLPYAENDRRWVLCFRGDGRVRAPVREAVCCSCGTGIHLAECVVCPSFFVVTTAHLAGGTRDATSEIVEAIPDDLFLFTCDAHCAGTGGTVADHQQRGAQQRTCPRCNNPAAPSPL